VRGIGRVEPMNKTVTGLSFMSALLLVTVGAMFVGLTEANPVPAPPILEVYIRSDGTVYPPTVPIKRTGNTYIFTSDITNATITVERDNIIIDGAGHKLQGNYYWWDIAITLTNRSNVVIKNIDIRDYAQSIFITESSRVIIYRNNMLTDGNIYLDSSSSNQIVGNNITSYNTYGIQFERGSSGNSIVGNNFFNAGVAVRVDGGGNNTFYYNNFVDNAKNVIAYGANGWDNGSVGNFWSDYEGADADADGVGDAPYVIDSEDGRRDRYPLMVPFNVSSVTVEMPEWANPPDPTEPFPTAPVTAASVAVVAASAGVIVYFKKRKH
jgi:nitrous oxidase accessory protein NosD